MKAEVMVKKMVSQLGEEKTSKMVGLSPTTVARIVHRDYPVIRESVAGSIRAAYKAAKREVVFPTGRIVFEPRSSRDATYKRLQKRLVKVLDALQELGVSDVEIADAVDVKVPTVVNWRRRGASTSEERVSTLESFARSRFKSSAASYTESKSRVQRCIHSLVSHGVSLTRIARDLGVSVSAVSRWKDGYTFPRKKEVVDRLVKLADSEVRAEQPELPFLEEVEEPVLLSSLEDKTFRSRLEKALRELADALKLPYS